MPKRAPGRLRRPRDAFAEHSEELGRLGAIVLVGRSGEQTVRAASPAL
ncbi:hypothetical protein [Lentzea albidocapillata]|nr:hypothetical protein [Lentzea albidocapillata]